MEFADAYKRRGISCESIYGEISAKLSGVRAVASFDPEISTNEYDEIAEEIGDCIQYLLKEYAKEIGIDPEQ